MWPSGLTLAMILTLNFQGQIWNVISQPTWSDCDETKSNIDWTQGLKCDHRVWPWPMTLTLNFQGQIYNLLYLSRKWPDWHETKSKHINWTQGLKCDLDLWPHTWPWPWIAVISEWEGRLTLNKGCGSRSFMTMTVTIWWPRSDVRICQRVTEVTSDVGVPLTHLIYTNNGNHEADDIFKSFNS